MCNQYEAHKIYFYCVCKIWRHRLYDVIMPRWMRPISPTIKYTGRINKFFPWFINSCFTPYRQYFNYLILLELINCRTPISEVQALSQGLIDHCRNAWLIKSCLFEHIHYLIYNKYSYVYLNVLSRNTSEQNDTV